ncbi:MAG: alanine racemase, partial [Patescibacteria group bacterium]
GKFDSEGSFRTWVEINKNAVQKNIATFRKLIGPESMPRTNSRKRFGAGVKLWAVVKSNAYGHGLVRFSKLAEKNTIDGFCVDSFIEAVRLRKEGIKKSILVLGPTLAELAKDASSKDITLSVSNFETLKSLVQTKTSPNFHIKLDTGMSRQGFFLEDIPRVIKFLDHRSSNLDQHLSGVYTHFASAKDINYPTYTDRQFETFNKAVKLFEKAGYKNLVKHVSATGGAMINPKYHLDAVRIGIGLYGLWPAKELELQLSNKIYLKPVLAWKTIVSEVKTIPQGQFVGYDLVERVSRPTKIAILPIGYWHGLPRALSSVGEVLINGRRARILGRVSMDLTVVDVTGIKCQVGDIATLIGKDGVEEISAEEMARLAQTSHYEIVTRLNPLMERVLT